MVLRLEREVDNMDNLKTFNSIGRCQSCDVVKKMVTGPCPCCGGKDMLQVCLCYDCFSISEDETALAIKSYWAGQQDA